MFIASGLPASLDTLLNVSKEEHVDRVSNNALQLLGGPSDRHVGAGVFA